MIMRLLGGLAIVGLIATGIWFVRENQSRNGGFAPRLPTAPAAMSKPVAALEPAPELKQALNEARMAAGSPPSFAFTRQLSSVATEQRDAAVTSFLASTNGDHLYAVVQWRRSCKRYAGQEENQIREETIRSMESVKKYAPKYFDFDIPTRAAALAKIHAHACRGIQPTEKWDEWPVLARAAAFGSHEAQLDYLRTWNLQHQVDNASLLCNAAEMSERQRIAKQYLAQALARRERQGLRIAAQMAQFGWLGEVNAFNAVKYAAAYDSLAGPRAGTLLGQVNAASASGSMPTLTPTAQTRAIEAGIALAKSFPTASASSGH
jgi:hypothetical protein